MLPILNAYKVSKQFGAKPLFSEISLTISERERIGLIGPNGAGKSTLLSILAGIQSADSGEVTCRKSAQIAYVRQESEFQAGTTVRVVLEASMSQANVSPDDREARLHETAGRTGFRDFDVDAASLSGGWRKRLAIAAALVMKPDVLLLDEPTNHLDIAGISWLEGLLTQAEFASVVISHDRYFLENVATGIVELNPIYANGIFRVEGSYSRFIEARSAHLEAQSRTHEALQNRVRTEIEWLRRGAKARTTKSKARISSANELIGKVRDMNARSNTRSAGIRFEASERQTTRLAELEDVSFGFGSRRVVEDLSLLIAQGSRIGLVGPNGSGKTSLLRLIAGELQPDSGIVRRAPSLRVVYFCQTRELQEGVTLRQALAPDSDSVLYQGNVVHVASYASRFLFRGEQLNQPVERLSGGERARLLIAKLMLEPADLLLLDEPTNDLDIPTLEVLEETLLEYTGALILVTHDRYMLNRVSTTVLGLDGKGNAAAFADYSQWEQWMEQSSSRSDELVPPVETRTTQAVEARKKLSYIEAREYATLEARIEAADERVRAAHSAIDDPAVATDAVRLTSALEELRQAQSEADALYARWAELSEKAG